VVCDWVLGDDDPTRPHPLRVASPNAALDEREDEALLRRREQALFDRRAQECGFVVLGFSAARTVARSPAAYGPTDRAATSRYDARAPIVFDDVGRAELARDTKHALGLAAIGAALGGSATLDHALREVVAHLATLTGVSYVVAHLATLTGVSYVGVEPVSLEPLFESEHRARIPFDELPTSARTILAFGVLTARALHAAYPGRPPRDGEGVVLIDEVELHQEASVARAVVPSLRVLFPRVQWIVSTSSREVALACEASDVIALRRMPSSQKVEIHEGPLAVIH
jgi:hypothetical protein